MKSPTPSQTPARNFVITPAPNYVMSRSTFKTLKQGMHPAPNYVMSRSTFKTLKQGMHPAPNYVMSRSTFKTLKQGMRPPNRNEVPTLSRKSLLSIGMPKNGR